MAAEILLSSEQFVKSVTSISDNVAGKYLLPSLREAQEVGLRGIVGDILLAKLKAEAAAGTLSGIYKDAVDRAQYYLAYTTIVELTSKVTYKINNFGVSKSNDEKLDVVGVEELGLAQAYWQSKADSACLDYQHWLLQNRAQLPELTASACDRIGANLRSAATCGIFLGGARGKIIRNYGKKGCRR